MLRKAVAAFACRTDGAAAVEMALWATILTLPMLSVVDLGVYTYKKMQVENAAEMAVQAAWRFCDSTATLPAVQNCKPNAGLLVDALRAAAQSTTLTTNVTVALTGVTEGYYCTNSSGALQLVGTAGSLSPATAPVAPTPNDCSTVLGTAKPGDFIQVTVSYTYTPTFSGISMAGLLPTPITKTAWMRLN